MSVANFKVLLHQGISFLAIYDVCIVNELADSTMVEINHRPTQCPQGRKKRQKKIGFGVLQN